MNKKQMIQAIIIFIALTLAGLLMILAPYQVHLAKPAVEASLQNSMPLIGTSLLGAGIAFFLLEMTRMERESK